MTAITASTSTDSTSLSAVPNVWIAHSLTGPGVRSMTADPTAVRASASGRTNDGQQLGHPESDGGRSDAGHRPRVARASCPPSYPPTDPKGLPKSDVG